MTVEDYYGNKTRDGAMAKVSGDTAATGNKISF